MAQHYPWLLETYDAFPENIMRADTARVLYMHRFGGARGTRLPVACLLLLRLAGVQVRELCLYLIQVRGLRTLCRAMRWFESTIIPLEFLPVTCDSMLQCAAGLYADLDFDVLKPFDSLIAGQTLLLAAMNDDEAFNHRIPNAWMASAPGHPFWFFCMQHIIAAAAPCAWQPRKR